MSLTHPVAYPDTQWPRWEVFKQDAPNKPHQAVGSVHAADPEHALLTARHVFVRRPSTVSLWVAPEEAIFSVTREELEAGRDPWPAETDAPAASHEPLTYLVFAKTSHKRAMTFVDHLGEVKASSPREALEKALEAFQTPEATVPAWWLVPARVVVKSSGDDAESWFAPAKDKTYKQQSAYGFVKPRSGEGAT